MKKDVNLEHIICYEIRRAMLLQRRCSYVKGLLKQVNYFGDIPADDMFRKIFNTDYAILKANGGEK